MFYRWGFCFVAKKKKKKKKMLISRYLIKEIIDELRVSLKLTVEKEKSNCKQNFDAFVQL